MSQQTTRPYEALLEAVWCPICGRALTVQEKDGKKMLCCGQHGEMKAYLDQNPNAVFSALLEVKNHAR